MNPEAMTILLAEDDDGHALLVERNLRRAGVGHAITRLHDGQEALDFLFRAGRHAGRTSAGPLLVLLDIRMPRVDGLEVLRRMKEAPDTAGIPVVMLTTSDSPSEITRCYQLGCSLYVTKPVDYTQLVDALQRLAQFLPVVTLPAEHALRHGGHPS